MIKTTKDGRVIRTGLDYSYFRRELWGFQSCGCSVCGRYTDLTLPPEYGNSFHVHHKNGRGMGGGRRDDTFKSCEGKCGSCHRKGHGQ